MYKKKTSKVLSLVLSLVLFTVLLSACGNNIEKNSDASGSTSATATVATKATDSKPALEPVELTWYMDGTPQDDLQPVLDEVNKILKDKINAKLNLNIIDWGSFDDKMKVLLVSGEPIDLCFTSNWANNYVLNAGKGAFLAMDDLLLKYAKPYYDSVPQKYWDSVRVNGKIYGAVNYQVAYNQTAAFLKKDIVDKYKFDVSNIKTIKDLEPMFEVVKKSEPGMFPVLCLATNSIGKPNDNIAMGWKYDDMKSSLAPYGVDAQKKDYKALNLLETPEYLEYYKTIRDWYLKGYIPKDAAAKKDSRAEAKTGKYFAVADSYKPGGEIDEKNRVGYDVVPVLLSIPEADAQIGSLTAIPKSSLNPERAMMFMNLVNTDKTLYNLLCHGIENKHYKKVDDVTIENIDKSGYTPGLDWEFGTQFNGYFLKGQANTLWSDTIKANEAAQMSSMVGFNFNSDAVKNEVAQIGNILGTYMPSLYTGSTDTQKTITLISEKIKASGGERVLAELQKQIDAWRTASGK